MMKKRTLTTGEVARYCDVNFRTVIRWVERGELKAYELPGRGDKRIEVSDFIAFLQKYHLPIPEEFWALQKRVLIVDDDISMAHAIQRPLRRLGFETKLARDGFEAGAFLGTFGPAVMTLDLNMPGLNGIQVLRMIRDFERLNTVKILVVSALPQESLDEALANGADDIPHNFSV